MKEKKSLFGGALRCAGLAAVATVTSPALADFQSIPGYGTPNYTFNYTVDAAGNTPVFAYDLNFAGGFPLTTTTANGDVYLTAYANAGAIGAGAFAYGPGATAYSYMGAVVWQYFTVGTDAKRGTVYWDLAAGNQYAFVYMYHFGGGILLDEIAGSVGQQHFVFTAGESYALIIRASMSNALVGDSVFGVMVWEVPAPAAIGLLGLGMAGTRRRRRS
jgi:MYXO-CTERM domain-containing protein